MYYVETRETKKRRERERERERERGKGQTQRIKIFRYNKSQHTRIRSLLFPAQHTRGGEEKGSSYFSFSSDDDLSFSFILHLLLFTSSLVTRGIIYIVIAFPSIPGCFSKVPYSSMSCMNRSNISLPMCRKSFSRPRNWQITFTLSPLLRNFCEDLNRTS